MKIRLEKMNAPVIGMKKLIDSLARPLCSRSGSGSHAFFHDMFGFDLNFIEIFLDTRLARILSILASSIR